MRLEEHLGDACSPTEVAIDLEGWMGVHEVRVGAPTTSVAQLSHGMGEGEKLPVQLVGPITIRQAAPRG